MRRQGDNASLHVIIFDEIDALCKVWQWHRGRHACPLPPPPSPPSSPCRLVAVCCARCSLLTKTLLLLWRGAAVPPRRQGGATPTARRWATPWSTSCSPSWTACPGGAPLHAPLHRPATTARGTSRHPSRLCPLHRLTHAPPRWRQRAKRARYRADQPARPAGRGAAAPGPPGGADGGALARLSAPPLPTCSSHPLLSTPMPPRCRRQRCADSPTAQPRAAVARSGCRTQAAGSRSCASTPARWRRMTCWRPMWTSGDPPPPPSPLPHSA